jgi:hypothetical protein
MRNEFVMRGKTASGEFEILNFGKYKQGTAYKMTEFSLYPSTNFGTVNGELAATVTAAKLTGSPPASPADPANPDFNQEGLIATAIFQITKFAENSQNAGYAVINDTFLITQNLILSVVDTQTGAPMDVNWQCRFESVKMSGAEEAAVNYKQFSISDGS